MSEKNNWDVFMVTSGFGHNTQKPFVGITVGSKDFHAQMSPEEAVDLAHNLLACAEAALSDAYLIEFFRKVVQVDDERIALMLIQFRKFREERGGKP